MNKNILFEINQDALLKAVNIENDKLQNEFEYQEWLHEVEFCLKHGLCPKCGNNDIDKHGLPDLSIIGSCTMFKCKKCFFEHNI